MLNSFLAFIPPLQDLEEELELDRRRVSEAEGVAKRAEEELAVAKERLLLQEDELQSRAGSLPLAPVNLTCPARSELAKTEAVPGARPHSSFKHAVN